MLQDCYTLKKYTIPGGSLAIRKYVESKEKEAALISEAEKPEMRVEFIG